MTGKSGVSTDGLVLSCCWNTAGDWLQGPYVYALYQHYGYGKGQIGQLFIAGFGSSMVFGTIVGSLGDTYGRKRACLLYCITYALSCATKHSPDFWMLMLGRVLGGIATSLLFSAFESWLIAEHHKHGFDENLLSNTFSKAVFLGNGLTSIASGLLSNALVVMLSLGPIIPFDASATVLTIAGLVIAFSWSENYGDCSGGAAVLSQFKTAFSWITNDERIALLGAIQSLFEASMYTFVFLWTPALSPNGEAIPHGMIFATFMLASMIGSSIAEKLMATSQNSADTSRAAVFRPESYLQHVFTVSSLLLATPICTSAAGLTHKIAQSNNAPAESNSGISSEAATLSFAGKLELIAFVAFELCVGLFWPSIMQLRAQMVPESVRSTVMNAYRIPLNLFVCAILFKAGNFSTNFLFGLCTVFLLAATACQKRLEVSMRRSKTQRWQAMSTEESDVELMEAIHQAAPAAEGK